jgi:3-oxoacyl-[acyl-carrier protein] reductase
MDGEFQGQTAIVTGAGRGIGRAVALNLADKGAAVAINDVQAARCMDVARMIVDNGGQAIPYPGDVANWNTVKEMVESSLSKLGTIDILVNNAGILRPTAPLEDIAEEEWDLVMAVNIKGAFNCMKAVLPIMKKQRGGRIVNVSSIAGRSTSNTGGAHYTASKAALLGLTRHAAREAAPYNININVIAPAGVDTPMVPEVTPPERIANIVERIPLGRLAAPAEIADLVIFLVSRKSSYITGATIDVNGGLLMI